MNSEKILTSNAATPEKVYVNDGDGGDATLIVFPDGTSMIQATFIDGTALQPLYGFLPTTSEELQKAKGNEVST